MHIKTKVSLISYFIFLTALNIPVDSTQVLASTSTPNSTTLTIEGRLTRMSALIKERENKSSNSEAPDTDPLLAGGWGNGGGHGNWTNGGGSGAWKNGSGGGAAVSNGEGSGGFKNAYTGDAGFKNSYTGNAGFANSHPWTNAYGGGGATFKNWNNYY